MPSRSEKGNPIPYLFRRVWAHSEGHRWKVCLFWALFIVAEAINVFIEPFLWARILNVIQTQGITPTSLKSLSWLLALALAITLLFWLFHGPARLLERSNAFRVRTSYRRHLLGGVMGLPMEWHADHHSGDTIDKVEKGANGLYAFAEDSFEVIYMLARFIGSFAMLAYFSRSAGAVALGAILVSGWITLRFDRVLIVGYRDLNRAENRISQSVFDAISNITTVIILRVERLVFGAIMRRIEQPYELQKRVNFLNEVKWSLTDICCSVMKVLVLGMYFRQHLVAGTILIGNVYLLIMYLQKISETCFRFTGLYGDLVKKQAKVMNAEQLSDDFIGGSLANHVLPRDWRRLEISNLDFAYHEGASQLERISMSIRRGERIAFVGESGSGKTTLLKVMRDLYRPQHLALSVDGRPMPQGFGSISRAIALVPQDPEIFATTIRENLTLGAEHDPETVRGFTDMACFTDVAESLPRKLESSINEKGVNLSGGQRQRLALARGLLACQDKDIVLLDEPTSSLDTPTEMRVYRNIFERFRNKTIISSIHRLHLLPLFETIYLFSEGRIVASGNLASLLASCPEFEAIWNHYHAERPDTPAPAL